MGKALFDRNTGRYLGKFRLLDPSDEFVAGPGQIMIEVNSPPHRRDHRWDGNLGVRRATTQERQDYDDLKAEELAEHKMDRSDKTTRAVIIWCAQHFGISKAQARSEIKAIYKAMGS